MKNKKVVVTISVIVIVIAGIFFYKMITRDKASTNTSDMINMTIDTDDGDEKIDWSIYENTNYELTKSITITEEGIYNLTGTITDGSITVNTEGNVKLILDGVNITNTSGPAIYVENVEDVVIELADNSNNYLEDGSTKT